MMRRSLFVMVFLGLSLILCSSVLASHVEVSGDQYFTLVDENNNIVHKTALSVQKGDIYIAADNSKYTVIRINGSIAECKYQGKEKMPEINYDAKDQAFLLNQSIPVAQNKEKPTIAVYHTHSDESYVPTDGKESILGDGGIYDVGKTLVSKLEEQGFNVEYSDAKHDPHDINAYNRSRRTAASLLKKGPDAIIDVHRDAVPADVYQAEIKGEDVTKIKLVLGRQNPNMKTNLEFAKQIKASMDKQEPGLSNGIYIGKGDYNQDLSPRSVLIEVGAHTNSKEQAEKGVSLFAETLPSVFGLSNAGGTTATNQNAPAKKPLTDGENKSAGTTVLIILGVLIAAGGGYYLLNKNVSQK